MFCQHIFTVKTLLATLTKVFFVFIPCFVKYKSVKIFGVHIMRLITINYMQQIYKVFKFYFWNVDWKSQSIFVAKQVNVVFYLNLVNFFSLQIFIFFLNSFSMYFIFTGLICRTLHQRKHLILVFDVN